MAHPVKLATPEDTEAVRPPVFVQLSTPPGPALLFIARVTDPELRPVSVLPSASWTATETEKVPVPVA
jgi:hypothetical protein